MSDEAIERASAALIDAHVTGRRFAARDQPLPLDLHDIYRIHSRVVSALAPGARIDTWKVSPPRGDMPATAAPVLPGRRLASPATVQVTDSHLCGIESELAFRFGVDLPPRGLPYEDRDVLAAVAQVCAAIELCDTRLSDWQEAPPLWRLADLQSGAMLVVGDAQPAWRAIDFARQEVELTINGALRMQTHGSHPIIDPSRLLPAIAAHCAEHGDGIRGGDVVTTGSWTGLVRAAPGDRILVRFAGIGTAQLQLAR